MIKTFRYFTKKQWAMIAGAIAFIVLQVWLDLLLPDYMSQITTLVETEGSAMSDILDCGWKMLACAAGSMAASMVTAYFAARVASGLSKTLRDKVYGKVMDFSMAEVNKFSASSLINRCTNDVTQIQNLVSMGLQAIIKAPIMAVWAIVKISGKSWQWSAATAAAVLILVVMLVITLVVALPRFTKIQTLTDNLNRIMREHISGIRVVRAFNARKYEEKKFSEANEELTHTNLVANRTMVVMNPTMTFINSALTLAVYWTGAYMISTTALNLRLDLFSEMVVFSNYAMQIVNAFMLLNMIFVLLPRAQVSAKRISEVLETPLSVSDGTLTDSPAPEKGSLEFKDVSFHYPDGKGNVLSNLSFSVKPGETLAVVGATGSGKSTLANLISRCCDPTSGTVLVDGQDVKNFTLDSLRSKVGYVWQKAMLFTGSVKDHLTMGHGSKGKASLEDAKEAASIAQADGFIEEMESGYDSPISQGGTNVSGGQKQRLCIARAVARKPEILVFDDSFSAMDFTTDKNCRKALNEKTKGTTKVIIAQRISTIRHADQILVLDHGKMAGCGTHEELMETCPVYQEIAQSQLSQKELAHV